MFAFIVPKLPCDNLEAAVDNMARNEGGCVPNGFIKPLPARTLEFHLIFTCCEIVFFRFFATF